MKKNLLLFLLFVTIASFVSAQQTMSFSSGANYSGFTFNGWNGSGGTIWHANLSSPASCSKNSGTWDFISFKIGPYTGSNVYRVTSNLGHTYDYSGNTTQVHVLNWTGVTSVSFSRISGSGAASDHDDFVFNETVLGLSELDSYNEIKIYPNPLKDQPFEITLSQGDKLIIGQVINLNGQIIKSFYSEKPNLSDIVSGIYFIDINTQRGRFVKKLVKL